MHTHLVHLLILWTSCPSPSSSFFSIHAHKMTMHRLPPRRLNDRTDWRGNGKGAQQKWRQALKTMALIGAHPSLIVCCPYSYKYNSSRTVLSEMNYDCIAWFPVLILSPEGIFFTTAATASLDQCSTLFVAATSSQGVPYISREVNCNPRWKEWRHQWKAGFNNQKYTFYSRAILFIEVKKQSKTIPVECRPPATYSSCPPNGPFNCNCACFY